MKHPIRTGVVACLAAGWVGGATASTDEAWAELRDRLVQACTDLAQAPDGAQVTVAPNEVGSDSYAVAVVTVAPAGDVPPDMSVCVMDKRSGQAELTVPFPPDQP